MNVPNIISLCRLLCVPVTVFLILNGMMLAAFWLFVAAGVSDAVDGYLAKRLGQISTLGSYLDPIADKALLVCVYLTLGQAGHLPTWLVIMVVSRDLLIVGGVVLLHVSNASVRMRPLLVSKINTVAQIALVVLVLAQLGFEFGLGIYHDLMIYLVAMTTVASGAAYIVSWSRGAGTEGDGQP